MEVLSSTFRIAAKAFGVVAYASSAIGCAAVVAGLIAAPTGMFEWIPAMLFAAGAFTLAAMAAIMVLMSCRGLALTDELLDVVAFREYKRSLFVLDRAKAMAHVWGIASIVSGIASVATLWMLPTFIVCILCGLRHVLAAMTIIRMYRETGCNEIAVERVFG